MDAELTESLTPKFRPKQNCGSVGANTLPSLDAPVQVMPVRLVSGERSGSRAIGGPACRDDLHDAGNGVTLQLDGERPRIACSGRAEELRRGQSRYGRVAGARQRWRARIVLERRNQGRRGAVQLDRASGIDNEDLALRGDREFECGGYGRGDEVRETF